jgi:hypothetical protein
MLIVTTPEAVPRRCGGQVGGEETGNAKRCVAHRILKIGWGYVKQVEIVSDDRSSPPNGLGRSERPVSIKDRCR